MRSGCIIDLYSLSATWKRFWSQKGIGVRYGAVRLLCGKFVRSIHSDYGTINYFWRAGGPKITVVDILVQTKRHRAARDGFFRQPINTAETESHTVVTDRLRSYSATLPRVLHTVRHEHGHWLSNRAEQSSTNP
jgi:hypothetical protein